MSSSLSQIDLLSRLLDAAATRQQIVGRNIANVNTPGYRRLSVEFETELQKQLSNPNPSAVNEIPIRITEAPGLSQRADGNTVDINRELGELSKNSMLFQMYSELLASRMGMLRSAITGR
jgi:flagellar basal-body rod protein FlgB